MLLTLVFVAMLGILVGGIVNVLADDLPLRRSPRLPRYVPDEKKMAAHIDPDEDDVEMPANPQADDERRPLIAWLGITAFLFGKRTSSDGQVTLGWRYPLTELLTAFLMALTVYATWNDPNVSDAQLILWLVYMFVFALIIVIDIEHKLILFVVVIPAAIIGLLDAYFIPAAHPPHLRDALYGAALGFGVFFLMYNGGFIFTYIMGKMRGEDINEIAFGYGDVMMATLSGIILGWQALIFAMFITVFLGAFGAMIYLVSRNVLGQKYSAYTALPYGPYIVVGTIAIMLFGAEIGGLFGGT